MDHLVDLGIELPLHRAAPLHGEAVLYMNGQVVLHGPLKPGRLAERAPMSPAMRAAWTSHQAQCRERGRLLRASLGHFRRAPYRFFHLGLRQPGFPCWRPFCHFTAELHFLLPAPLPNDWPPVVHYKGSGVVLHPFGRRLLRVPHPHWTPVHHPHLAIQQEDRPGGRCLVSVIVRLP